MTNSNETATKTGSTTPEVRRTEGGAGPLIAPKCFADYLAEEFYAHVESFYELRRKAGPPKAEPVAEGLALTRTKKGAISIRRTKTKRPFAFVTQSEVEALARSAGLPISEVWNAFKQKAYIIAKDRMAAERTYASLRDIPF